MLLARILEAMFDPEEKRKELEKKKKQAMDKVKLPPLTGYHSSNPECVSQADLMDEDTLWISYFTMSEAIRNKHGVKTIEGKWQIVDKEKFDLIGEHKKALLRPHWARRNA